LIEYLTYNVTTYIFFLDHSRAGQTGENVLHKMVNPFVMVHFTLRYADVAIFFRISGGLPSWICDGVIILHPVIDFSGRNTVQNFNVNWFGNFRTSLT